MTLKNALVFDIGGTKIATAVIDSDGEISSRHQRSTVTTNGPQQLINDLIEAAKEVSLGHEIHCIGISSAGPVDPFGGTLVNPTNMKTDNHSWGTVSLTEPLKKVFEVPVVLENDAAAAVIGESWKGEFRNSGNLLSMTLGTGIGVGAIVEGQLQRNRNGFHPEVSHISMNPFDSLAPCGCGNLGCIEAYLSGVNFPIYWANKNSLPEASGKELCEAAQAGDAMALKAFDHYSRLMAQALNSMVLIYSPEHVLFSGSFSAAMPFFKDKTNNYLKELLKDRRDGLDYLPTLNLSQIPDDAGLFGAAKMAFSAPDRL